MNSLLTALILVESFATALLGFIVFAENKKRRVNKAFSIMAVTGALWMLFAYFGGNIANENLSKILIQGDYMLGIMLAWTFWYFSVNYYLDIKQIKPTTNQKMVNVATLLIALTSAFLTLTSVFIEYSDINGDIVSQTTVLSDIFYNLPAVLFLLAGIFYLNKARISATKRGKARTNLIFIGLFGTLLIVGVPFLIISVLAAENLSISYLQQLSILGFFIFISSTAYAMVKHQLFDIRAALTRSIAYGLSLGTMLIIYTALIFVSSSILIDESSIPNTQKLVYAILAVVLASSFQPLKSFFDKFTENIFYRSSYDSEKLLSDYSDFLVDEIDTDKIIRETLRLMDEVSNPSNSLIVLYRGGVAIWYDINGMIHGDDKDQLAKALEYQSAPTFIADKTRIHEDAFMENIKKRMLEANLESSIRLSTHGQLEGFIMLGDKKSGTRYTQNDINFFVTIANEMSVSIQNSQRFDQIQHFNVTLQHEVDEATARLKQTNEKLKHLDTAKDEFISMASHQLRTPLTSVKGYISMVMEGDAGNINDDQRKLLSEAFASSQRMVYLIADLLNVSRLKTGKFVVEPTKVNLSKVVQEEVEQLTHTATTRQILLKYSPPSSFPTLLLDETKTRQVVMNFIDNAIYYTKNGGDIDVSLVAKKDKVEFRVKDSGIGIPASEQHKLFTKFFRASNAKRARPDGTGLGLYMAQKVITAQGGSITFKSSEGKGSTFGFNFPVNETTLPKE